MLKEQSLNYNQLGHPMSLRVENSPVDFSDLQSNCLAARATDTNVEGLDLWPLAAEPWTRYRLMGLA